MSFLGGLTLDISMTGVRFREDPLGIGCPSAAQVTSTEYKLTGRDGPGQPQGPDAARVRPAGREQQALDLPTRGGLQRCELTP